MSENNEFNYELPNDVGTAPPAPPAPPASNTVTPPPGSAPPAPPPEQAAPPAQAPAPTGATNIKRASFSEVFKYSFGILKLVWLKLIVFQLIIVASAFGGVLIMQFMPEVGMLLIIPWYIAQAFVSFWLTIASAHLIVGAESGIGLGEAAKRGLRHFLPFIWISFLSGLVVAGGNLLFIPGLFWSVTFIILIWVLVAEDVRGMDALVRARQWVRGDGFSIFIRLILIGFVLVLPMLLLSLAGGSPTDAGDETSPLHIGLALIESLYGALLVGPIITAFTFGLYQDLRRRKASALPALPRQKTYFIIAAIAAPLVIILIFVSLFSMLSSLFSSAVSPSGLDVMQPDAAEMNMEAMLDDLDKMEDDLEEMMEEAEEEMAEETVMTPEEYCSGTMAITTEDLQRSARLMTPEDVDFRFMFNIGIPGEQSYCLFEIDQTNQTLQRMAYLKSILANYRSQVGSFPSNLNFLTPESAEGRAVAALNDFEYMHDAAMDECTINASLQLKDSTETPTLSVSIGLSDIVNPRVDGDGDGISDADEQNVFGTDPTAADTDGDTYQDGAEIVGGFNPNANMKSLEPNDLMLIYASILRTNLHEPSDSELSRALFGNL